MHVPGPLPNFHFDEDAVSTFVRVREATPAESVVDRIEHAVRVTDEVSRAKGSPPFCRANVAPPQMRGYTPCMMVLPCPLHGDNPSFYESEEN